MITERLAKASEAIDLAIKRCKKEGINGDLLAALQSAETHIAGAVQDFQQLKEDDIVFFSALTKYGMGKMAELGRPIADILSDLIPS